MLADEGWPRGFIKKVPLYLSVFSTGHNRFLRFPLFLLKKLAFAVVRRLGKGMPTVSGAETWAFKNTMLAVQVIDRCRHRLPLWSALLSLGVGALVLMMTHVLPLLP